MGLLRVFCVFLVMEFTLAEDGIDGPYVQTPSILKPCPVEDIKCLSKATEMFLENTSAGIPAYDIKPIDPLVIPAIEVVPFDGLKLHYKNVNITGFKKQNISDFKLDKESGSVLLSTTVDVHYGADVTAEFPSVSKSFSGITSTKAEAITTARYDYKIKTDDKGVKHFDVGPETLTCEVIALDNTFDPELKKVMENDSDVKKILGDHNIVDLRKKLACKLISKGYETVVHNIRASAKALPKTAFFTNV